MLSPPLPDPKPWKTIVLTHWIEVETEDIVTGRKVNRRNAAIDYEYELNGWNTITSLPPWPKDQQCPYYGYMVEIDAKDETIEQIRNDKKYLIVRLEADSLDSIPKEDWMVELQDWLLSRGMPLAEAKKFVENVSGLTRKDIVDKLNELLKIPRPIDYS